MTEVAYQNSFRSADGVFWPEAFESAATQDLNADGLRRPEATEIAPLEEAKAEPVPMPEMTLERMVLPLGGSPLELSIREEIASSPDHSPYSMIKGISYGYVSALHYATFSGSYAQSQDYTFTFIRDEPRIPYQTETRYEQPLIFVPKNERYQEKERREESNLYRETRNREVKGESLYQERRDLPIEPYQGNKELVYRSIETSPSPFVPETQTQSFARAREIPPIRVRAYEAPMPQEAVGYQAQLSEPAPKQKHSEQPRSQEARPQTEYRAELKLESRAMAVSVSEGEDSPPPFRRERYEISFVAPAITTKTPTVSLLLHASPRLVEGSSPSLEFQLCEEQEAQLQTRSSPTQEAQSFPLEEKVKISSCYADGAHLAEARQYRQEHTIEERETNVPQRELTQWMREGKEVKGFLLAERLIADRTYANAYEALEALSQNTLEFQVSTYLDTDTGMRRIGRYLSDIAEFKLDAREQLGGKDAFGARLSGIIILINGREPEEGKVALENVAINPGDRIEIVYKSDLARYAEKSERLKPMLLAA
ncbi:MAG: hypothetical protein Q7S65_04595 [Nanoarchaeota archaeon]|nr:hypothetical protein [Nanoarchaeota archaeon]